MCRKSPFFRIFAEAYLAFLPSRSKIFVRGGDKWPFCPTPPQPKIYIHAFLYKNILYKNIQDEIGQKIKNRNAKNIAILKFWNQTQNGLEPFDL